MFLRFRQQQPGSRIEYMSTRKKQIIGCQLLYFFIAHVNSQIFIVNPLLFLGCKGFNQSRIMHLLDKALIYPLDQMIENMGRYIYYPPFLSNILYLATQLYIIFIQLFYTTNQRILSGYPSILFSNQLTNISNYPAFLL